MSGISTSIAAALSNIYAGIDTSESGAMQPGANPGPWRPPQWPSSKASTLTMTVKDPTTNITTAYIFDGIPRAEHEQQSVITLNPVQTGASLTDHAYVNPPRLTVEILMSDTMQSFTLGQWADNPSRSVSAYQQLVKLQKQRATCQIATRLNNYDNMLIASIRAEESKDTRYALKASVSFVGILTASVENVSSSISFSAGDASLPQTIGQTVGGEVATDPVPDSLEAQHNIANVTGADPAAAPVVEGAGSYTSTSLATAASVINF